MVIIIQTVWMEVFTLQLALIYRKFHRFVSLIDSRNYNCDHHIAPAFYEESISWRFKFRAMRCSGKTITLGRIGDMCTYKYGNYFGGYPDKSTDRLSSVPKYGNFIFFTRKYKPYSQYIGFDEEDWRKYKAPTLMSLNSSTADMSEI
jgi:hypothetical protein